MGRRRRAERPARSRAGGLLANVRVRGWAWLRTASLAGAALALGTGAVRLGVPAFSAETGDGKTSEGIAPPDSPASLRVISATTTEIHLGWDDHSRNEEGFGIERATQSAGVFTEIKAVKPNTTRYVDAGLTSGETYLYRVRAYNAAGQSEFSNTETIRTPVNWLVLIAINDYKEWPKLTAPLKDARELERVLQSQYKFDPVASGHTIELFNEKATVKAIYDLIELLKEKVSFLDTLLIFYAGHGHLESSADATYLIPYDAGLGPNERWLPDSVAQGIALNSKAKHILIIADSCYAGNLLAGSRGIGTSGAPTSERYRLEYDGRSREVLTATNLSPTPDAGLEGQSPFAWHLVRTLEENHEQYIDGSDLHYHVKRGVEGDAPQFGAMVRSGHEPGGSYVFMKKSAAGFELTPQRAPAAEAARDLGKGIVDVGRVGAAEALPPPPHEDQEPAIRKVIESWKACYEKLDGACMKEVYPSEKLPSSSSLKGYELEILPKSWVITSGESQATVNCTVVITAIGRGRMTQPPVHFRFELVKQSGVWKIDRRDLFSGPAGGSGG